MKFGDKFCSSDPDIATVCMSFSSRIRPETNVCEIPSDVLKRTAGPSPALRTCSSITPLCRGSVRKSESSLYNFTTCLSCSALTRYTLLQKPLDNSSISNSDSSLASIILRILIRASASFV